MARSSKCLTRPIINACAETQTSTLKNRDPRWVKIHRPVIIAGGELTLETLDLVWDEVHKYYEAPFQMKANGGMFLIDDFGRQQVRPRDLLNRWIVPLEKRVDYLTLHTGRKIEIPFDVLIVFSTNLAPRDLVDEAFLRRIRHKIEDRRSDVSKSTARFSSAWRTPRRCSTTSARWAYLMQEYYVKARRRLRAVHPRDLIEQMVDIARYLDVPMVMTKEIIDRACDAYFVEFVGETSRYGDFAVTCGFEAYVSLRHEPLSSTSLSTAGHRASRLIGACAREHPGRVHAGRRAGRGCRSNST